MEGNEGCVWRVMVFGGHRGAVGCGRWRMLAGAETEPS